jgi:hypothetical protein
MRSFATSVLCVAALAGGVSAQTVFNSDQLPPPEGFYSGAFASWGGGQITLSNYTLGGFSNSTSPPMGVVPATVTTNVTVQGTLSGSLLGGAMIPASATGTATFTFVDGFGSLYGSEITQLDLAGGSLPPGAMLRESPSLSSLGLTSLSDLGGGQYNIMSVFGVFTELSLDGGQTWIPSDGPTDIVLVPTPGAGVLMTLGLVALGRRRRSA